MLSTGKYNDSEARLARELARGSLDSGDLSTAWTHLHNLLSRLAAESDLCNADAIFVSACLDLSDLSFILGRGFNDLIQFLEKAITVAETIGDKRSRTLIHLHLGRMYYFADRRKQALDLFAEGIAEAEALGDEDMLIRSAEFFGLYYFIQGRYAEALGYFERGLQSLELSVTDSRLMNYSSPVWVGYCAAYLGQFHRAVSTLEYYYRFFMNRSETSLAVTVRAVLGTALLMLRKKKDAVFHLNAAIQDANQLGNVLALYIAQGGMVFYHFLEGRIKEGHELTIQNVRNGTSSGIIRQYASPWVLELHYEYHRSGQPDILGVSFQSELARILQEPNIHLRGVALRLRAIDKVAMGEATEAIWKDLEESESCLIRAGTPIQLAKTWLEMARFYLKAGNEAVAASLAQKAARALTGYEKEFFPDDLRSLLKSGDHFLEDRNASEELLRQFMDMMQELIPTPDMERMLTRIVTATNRLFGAERGGMFWFSQGKTKMPTLRAVCNIDPSIVKEDAFRSNLALVFEAFRKGQPCILQKGEEATWPYQGKAILCLPFEVGGKTKGVLYHDNTYVSRCFGFLDKLHLNRMIRFLSTYIQRLNVYRAQLEEKSTDVPVQIDAPGHTELITQSRKMREVLNQVDRVSSTGSTVLLTGETGVGKELIAQRVHRLSRNASKPMVVVDLATVPENLVESELFGHEKGAFTGADRKKMGRIELAHQGTLFIDEVGEIPKQIQVKLLRAIQEKSYVRVGGVQTLYSDFRLVVATNRNLAQEVAEGRFREDLYFRLNVVPIFVPPLRDRKEDILLLARHFMERYAYKYKRPVSEIKSEDELQLMDYSWPGNVRELKNIVERSVLMSSGGDLIFDLPSGRKARTLEGVYEDLPTLDEMQRRYIEFVINQTGGKIYGPGGAAEVLGLKRSTLFNRMKKLGLK